MGRAAGMIQAQLAERLSPTGKPIPLIAETGGQNGMRGGSREGPQRQLRRRDTGKNTRVAPVDQEIDSGCDHDQPGCDADLSFPDNQRQHRAEGQQDANNRHKVAHCQKAERPEQFAGTSVQQSGRDGQRPAHVFGGAGS